jgi:DNA repair exonuclease SbcCD ATPase subunit
MDHFRLSDELRQQLLENAAWGKAGVTPRLDEAKKEEDKKAKKKEDKKEEDKKEEGGYKDAESSKELEEAVHVCPLCVSQLDEPLDEESILEHLNVVVGLVDRLTQLQEGEEDIESVIDETLAELLFQDLEEE